MEPAEFHCHTRVLFGPGVVAQLEPIARQFGFRRSLVVADRGVAACGYVDQVGELLSKAGAEGFHFQDFHSNPDSDMIESGRAFAALLAVDSIIGLGGGSSMDCARAINFVLTNGGHIQDYEGYGKAQRPLLPMIGIPTTSGTGSEAQSYALISHAKTHVKMACGDPKAAFQVALLDPVLTLSQPAEVTAATGFDAIAHAVETFTSTRRSPFSEPFSRHAWRLLESNFERVLQSPDDLEARGAMQLGAHFAGIAIENSMLGATHACANPLTARYDTTHGVAIALLLPSVVRWNRAAAAQQYVELESYRAARVSERPISATNDPTETLARRLEQLAAAGNFPSRAPAVPKEDLPALARQAAEQWTARFNPRPFDAAGALEIYECVF
ncbi:MAG: iron-containing alcohol dehydrogenase [Acidobacteriota bacterium]